MMTKITLDIETIPAQGQAAHEYIAKTVKPPKTMKVKATIDKWHAEDKAGAIIEEIGKTSFDGAFGQIVCIGFAIDDSEAISVHDMAESKVLTGFNEALSSIPVSDWYTTTIIGHNVADFDLRFLYQRYIVNGIKPHPIITRAAKAKKWDSEKVFDTMAEFSGIGKSISLDKLCFALGMEGKGDISGADVWPMVQAGRLEEVAEYCRHDVTITREVFKRMAFA
jgi:hypothetical protein